MSGNNTKTPLKKCLLEIRVEQILKISRETRFYMGDLISQDFREICDIIKLKIFN